MFGSICKIMLERIKQGKKGNEKIELTLIGTE